MLQEAAGVAGVPRKQQSRVSLAPDGRFPHWPSGRSRASGTDPREPKSPVPHLWTRRGTVFRPCRTTACPEFGRPLGHGGQGLHHHPVNEWGRSWWRAGNILRNRWTERSPR